jgi:hypothetical protein
VPYQAGSYCGDVAFKRLSGSRAWTLTDRGFEIEGGAGNPPALTTSRLEPQNLAQRIGLGAVDASGIRRRIFPLADAARWYFSFLGFPRLENIEPLRVAVIEGVKAGEFGLVRVADRPALDHLPLEIAKSTRFGAAIHPAEIQFHEHDYLVTPEAFKS